MSGPVAETHDLLYGSALSIAAETILPIRHCLVGLEAVALDRIREIRSHPVALDQCRQLLAAMPQSRTLAAGTTADAAHQVADLGDPSVAAIASERAARLYGLTVISGNVPLFIDCLPIGPASSATFCEWCCFVAACDLSSRDSTWP